MLSPRGRSSRSPLALLAALSTALLPLSAAGDPPVIVPLPEHAARYGVTETWSRRFILDRCAALYIFAASTAKGRQPAQYAEYDARAAAFLTAAMAAADRKEVLLMLITRMSSAYKRSSDAGTEGGEDPLAHPFFRSELGFCEAYAASGLLTQDPPQR